MNNRTTIMIALLMIVMMVGSASATVTADSLAVSPEFHFYGQNVTVTWTSTSPQLSYIWINKNASWDGDDSHSDGNMSNDLLTEPARINQTPVECTSLESPYSFTYTFANWTVNSDVETWKVWVRDDGNSTFATTLNSTLMYTNAYNVTIHDDRSAADGNSTLAGDNVTVCINTSGLLGASMRDGLPFNITLPEGGSRVLYPYVNVAESGNYTFTINTTKAGVGVLRNITLTYGSPANFSWNSTQLAVNVSLWSSEANWLQFNVSQVNLKAYDVPVDTAGAAPHNITSVNITTLDLGGNLISANPAYPVNVTLTNSITSPSIISFNCSHDGFVSPNNYTVNLSFVAGDGNIPRTNLTGWCNTTYGNYTHPLNTSGAITTSAGTHTITAKVNTSGTEWTDAYLIHPTTEKVTLEPPADTSYQIGEYVLITGWNCTPGGNTWVNITGPGTSVLTNSTAATNSQTDGGFTHNWSTNWIWNDQQNATWNATTYNKTGIYTITAGNGTSSSAWYDTYTITLNENITVVPNATSIPVNGSLWINGTSDRWNSNDTVLHCNISTGADRTGRFVNGTLSNVTSTFNATTGLATYSILWNSRDNLSDIVTAAAPVDSSTYNGLYYITVNDSAQKNTAATFRITDSISVSPATGVAGLNCTVRGTSSRDNGTVINVSLRAKSGLVISSYADAYVYGNVWNTSINASDSTGALSTIAPYTIIANDSIVRDTSTLTLGAGVINLEPIAATMDDLVWFNGTTDLSNGTWIWFNITTSAGKSINTTTGDNHAVVTADQTFNQSWQVNTSWISGNFTAPETAYTVNASNGSIYALGTLTVAEHLAITTPDFEIAPGCEFKIEGTLNRINGTEVKIIVETSAGDTANDTATATVYGGEFNQTLTATYSYGDLPKGAYTITVKDAPSVTSTGSAVNASALINMTVATASAALTGPADGASYEVNQTIPISGTSNLGNNTRIDVTISKISGEGFTNSSYAMTNWTGHWNATWNTTADSAFQALSDKTGNYQINAVNATHSANAISRTITIAAVPTVDTIVVDPAGPVSLPNVSDTQQFNATCYNGTDELTGITVTWASENESVGTIDLSSGLFTALANGTTNVTATAQGKASNAVEVTVGEAGLPRIGDINGNGAVTLADAIYLAKHVAEMSGYETLSDDGDINGNGAVTLADAIYLAKHVAGMSGYETLY